MVVYIRANEFNENSGCHRRGHLGVVAKFPSVFKIQIGLIVN